MSNLVDSGIRLIAVLMIFFGITGMISSLSTFALPQTAMNSEDAFQDLNQTLKNEFKDDPYLNEEMSRKIDSVSVTGKIPDWLKPIIPTIGWFQLIINVFYFLAGFYLLTCKPKSLILAKICLISSITIMLVLVIVNILSFNTLHMINMSTGKLISIGIDVGLLFWLSSRKKILMNNSKSLEAT
jgi:hypothetical protein